MITTQVIGSVGVSTSRRFIGTAFRNFNQQIQKLFANGEQGFFYDPSDMGTMYQDAAGTVPVTAVGQPVGLILDKSGGLIIGSNIAAISSASKTVDGTQTDYLINNATYANKWYVVEFDVLSVASQPYINIAGALTLYFDTSSIGVGHSKLMILANSSGQIRISGSASSRYSIANITVKNISGNHAYQSTSASRPILRKNAETGANYLEFDGSDDFLRTSNIDFTGTNKMSLFAGLNRTGNATIGTVLETGTNYTTPTGGFAFQSPQAVGVNSVNLMASSGGASVYTAGSYAPNVFTYAGFIDLSKTTAKDQVKFRVNGVYEGASRSNLAGNGNFGNVPVYIGRRSGTSQPFNGHIYGLIGTGKLASENETLVIEKELAKRTGVTLNV